MGVATLVQRVTGGGLDRVEAARLAVKRAEDAAEAEGRRIAATEQEISESSDAITAADPDADPRVFSKLVQQRDAARGRLEALTVRQGRAARTLEEARTALAAAEVDEQRAEMERLDNEIARMDRELTEKARALAGEIKARIEEMRVLGNKAAGCEHKVRSADGTLQPGYVNGYRRSRWLTTCGRTPLEQAGNVLEAVR